MSAALVVAIGYLVGAVGRADAGPSLIAAGVLFVLMQVVAPLHAQLCANLGDRLESWLNERLLDATLDTPGIAHLESADLTDDLTLARDYELGLSGPPMSLSLTFIAGGLQEIVAGLAQAAVLFAYSWWAPLLVGGVWAATHRLLRTSTVWDRNTGEVLAAQRTADYSYRLVIDAPAAKEVRLWGIGGWVVDRFAENRRRLVDLRWAATRLEQRLVGLTVALLVVANGLFFWSLASDAADGRVGLTQVVIFAQAALGTSLLAFGGLNWTLPHAAGAVGAVLRLLPEMANVGQLTGGERTAERTAEGMPAAQIRLRDVTFGYPDGGPPVLDGVDLTVPAGSSLAIVGVNGAGKTTLAKLLCRLYDPTGGAIEVDGVDLRRLDVASWRSRVTAVFQDFIHYQLPLRDNVAPTGGTDGEIRAALALSGADGLAELHTVLDTGYDGGTDLSGGQWQRVALARALLAVQRGAGVVILDEPTAQLDVRGEAEIFQRILTATRDRTTVLVSHRFSTVRHADRICVLEKGRIAEYGTHDELIAADGVYRSMFDMQASRFGEEVADGVVLD